MKPEKQTLRLGLAVVICALVLRLITGGPFANTVAAIASPEWISFALFLETGRVYRPVLPAEVTVPETVEQTLPPQQTQPPQEEAVAVFSPEDAALVEVNSVCGYPADVPSLLSKALDWDLKSAEPTVLILHAHATESYENTVGYEESAAYRTLDTGHNMVSVGQHLTQILEANGIRVIHDTALHDYPSYTDSYNQSRASAKAYLEQYPSIRLVLDLHRDSVETAAGQQLSYKVGETAQLMFVVGTNASGLDHPNWYENLALAVKLHAQLEKQMPGICRPISFRSQRFNQDLSPGALLIEVGAAGNSREEALRAAEHLAQAVLALSGGATTGYPTS